MWLSASHDLAIPYAAYIFPVQESNKAFCRCLGFILLWFWGFSNQLLFLLQSHIWCSGATTRRPGLFKPQSAVLFHACFHFHWFCSPFCSLHLFKQYWDKWWNCLVESPNETVSFYCSTPKILKDVRTSSASHCTNTFQQSLTLDVYKGCWEDRQKIANKDERFEVICSRSHTGWVLGIEPSLLTSRHPPSQ